MNNEKNDTQISVLERERVYRCLFEQSGTFKNEFIKLGFKAYDYDILNDFEQTDYVCDLYAEIEKAFNNKESIFDTFAKDDVILAFFPCTRFEAQILLWYRGEAMQQKNWSLKKKLEYDLKIHDELSKNYEMITKLVLVALKKEIPIIIENPYSEQHYLNRYWCVKSAVVDNNRWEDGDYEKKPTQYWFIGINPENNLLLEEAPKQKLRTHNSLFGTKNCQVERSMISPVYASRFIKRHLIKGFKEEKTNTLFDFLKE